MPYYLPDNPPEPVPIISAATYAHILATPWLRGLLLPEGLVPGPYHILDYQSVIVLHDGDGLRATVHRTQRVRFLQEGVAALLDHAWGDGILLTDYQHSAGQVLTTLRDGDRRHLVVRLRHPMRRGEDLGFTITRRVMTAFCASEEWVETTLDHPVRHLRCVVVFPVERPCRAVWREAAGVRVVLPVHQLAQGRSAVILEPPTPKAHHPYVVRWAW